MIPTIESLQWVTKGFYMMPHQLEAAKNEALQMIEYINKLQGQVKPVGLADVGETCEHIWIPREHIEETKEIDQCCKCFKFR